MKFFGYSASMRYRDRIYGEMNIEDPVLCDIIATADFQRLKGVDMARYCDVYFPGTKHTRYEHSIGCCLLLKKYGASLEEQIAGLIHDVSHSAFSHTADYVFAGGRGADQNYQDDIFVDFLSKTSIPDILAQHGYDAEYIANEKNFPLQENNLPDICADRIDYALRGARVYAGVAQETIDDILHNLTTDGKQWYFTTYDSAWAYAQLFKNLNDVYYSAKQTGAMFGRTALWLRRAVEKNYITYAELFTTDDDVIYKINAHLHTDATLAQYWDMMNTPDIRLGEKGDADVIAVIVKSRHVDPLFCHNGAKQRVSDKNPRWRAHLAHGLRPKTYYIRY